MNIIMMGFKIGLGMLVAGVVFGLAITIAFVLGASLLEAYKTTVEEMRRKRRMKRIRKVESVITLPCGSTWKICRDWIYFINASHVYAFHRTFPINSDACIIVNSANVPVEILEFNWSKTLADLFTKELKAKIK